MDVSNLNLIRKEKGLSIEELAQLANLPKSTIEKILFGIVKNPRLDTVEAIKKALGLNEKNPTNIYEVDGLITMPIIGSISAGYDGKAVEEILGNTSVLPISLHGYNPEECFLLQVKGDSMYPDFHNKDIVLVHRQTSVDSGSIAVIMYNGDEATLKKVVYKQNEDWMELIPRNPEYLPKRIENTELQECRVLGKVISLVHREI